MGNQASPCHLSLLSVIPTMCSVPLCMLMVIKFIVLMYIPNIIMLGPSWTIYLVCGGPLVNFCIVDINYEIFMPPLIGGGGIMFSGCLSEPWNNLFSPVHGSVGSSDQPSSFCGMSVCPVRPSVLRGFRPFARERMEGMVWNFYILMYVGHVHKLLHYGHGLSISLPFPSLWLSETGKIWGFWAICQGRHAENGLKICMLIYHHHLQNWLH